MKTLTQKLITSMLAFAIALQGAPVAYAIIDESGRTPDIPGVPVIQIEMPEGSEDSYPDEVGEPVGEIPAEYGTELPLSEPETPTFADIQMDLVLNQDTGHLVVEAIYPHHPQGIYYIYLYKNDVRSDIAVEPDSEGFVRHELELEPGEYAIMAVMYYRDDSGARIFASDSADEPFVVYDREPEPAPAPEPVNEELPPPPLEDKPDPIQPETPEPERTTDDLSTSEAEVPEPVIEEPIVLEEIEQTEENLDVVPVEEVPPANEAVEGVVDNTPAEEQPPAIEQTEGEHDISPIENLPAVIELTDTVETLTNVVQQLPKDFFIQALLESDSIRSALAEGDFIVEMPIASESHLQDPSRIAQLNLDELSEYLRETVLVELSGILGELQTMEMMTIEHEDFHWNLPLVEEELLEALESGEFVTSPYVLEITRDLIRVQQLLHLTKGKHPMLRWLMQQLITEADRQSYRALEAKRKELNALAALARKNKYRIIFKYNDEELPRFISLPPISAASLAGRYELQIGVPINVSQGDFSVAKTS